MGVYLRENNSVHKRATHIWRQLSCRDTRAMLTQCPVGILSHCEQNTIFKYENSSPHVEDAR